MCISHNILKMWKSEIEEIMKHDDTFLGCYPHDRLPNLKGRTNCGTIKTRVIQVL